MRFRHAKSAVQMYWATCLATVLFTAGSVLNVSAQNPPGAPAQPQIPAESPLLWDAMSKETSPKEGDQEAKFIFHVTNTSAAAVLITEAHASCGCTVPHLPRDPWIMPPKSADELEVTINLLGKIGQFYKTVTVMASNLPTQVLTLQVNMPNTAEAQRMANQMAAATDRQAVFKGDCASCHVEPAKGKMSTALYVAACNICHEPVGHPRAAAVPDLKNLNKPTDYAYWKQWIESGKPGTMMPAFAENQGGPLNAEQVESLAKLLSQKLPPAPAPAANPGGTNSIPSIPNLPPPPTRLAPLPTTVK